ncbi:MAG: hypothetical protein COA75_07760 [Cellvibrionales bacterium]|nr:MAG: hypothetical protein COA75_07760 [Cellvibrionales bacterium]
MFAGTCFFIFLYRQLRGPNPFINVRLLGRWNFGMANVIGVILGLGLYGTIFITPLYLAQIQDYNALQIGVTMMWFGFPQLIAVPLIVRLMKTVDLRHLVAFGCVVFAWSCLINIHMNADSGYDQLLLANFIRGIGQPFLSIPLAVMATVGIEKTQVGSASGLYNLTRNLGGAVGIAFLAQEQAIRTIDAIARRESMVMAYNDAFYFVGAAFVFGACVTYTLKPFRPLG